MILVDSSVWIAAWRGHDSSLVQQLSELIEKEKVAINGLIRTELLQGAKDTRHQKELKKLLEPVSLLALPEALWDESARLYLKSREIGVTLTTVDCLIATQSILSRLPLWSLDQVFKKIPDIRNWQEA